MGKNAPAAPDPAKTAAAQTGTNVGTAIANSYLGNVNQNTPDGALNYTYGPEKALTIDGKTYNIPQVTANQTLSENGQAVKTQTDAAKLNLAGLANQQSGQLQDSLSKPFEYNNQDAENWSYDLGSKRLDPRFAQQEEATRTRLLNSGIREGSAAWNSEFNQLNQSKNDAYNQLSLQGRQQGYNEARDQYTLPVNTVSALLSGSQVQNPNFVNAQQPTIPTTDTAGITQQNYQSQVAAYNQQQAGLGGLFSGLGSFGGSLIGLSDDDAKTDKKKIGKAKGQNLWEFRYKGEPKSQPKHVGLMASEVEKKNPGAVHRGEDGLRRVDYGKALGLRGMK